MYSSAQVRQPMAPHDVSCMTPAQGDTHIRQKANDITCCLLYTSLHDKLCLLQSSTGLLLESVLLNVHQLQRHAADNGPKHHASCCMKTVTENAMLKEEGEVTDLDNIHRVDKQPCSHAQKIWLPSCHVIAAIQLCSCLPVPAARSVEDFPVCP